MKNLIAIVTMIFSVALANAQNYEVLYMQDIHNEDAFLWCVGTIDGVIIYGNPACGARNQWNYGEGDVYCDSIVLICDNQPQQTQDFEVFHWCGSGTTFHVVFIQTDIENPFPEPVIWKRQGESVTLTAGAVGWNYHWSNDSTENQIEVTAPGTYTVNISDGMCLDRTFSIEVCDNVELFRATTNLTSNCNQATWQTTPEQAGYVQEVNVYRNNQLVATVPYTDGVFTDNIGSADAPWQYHLVAVSNGEECPLRSYWARTISMSDLMGSQGTQTLTWTSYEQENPAKDDEVQAYGIFDVVGGNPRLVIEVGSFVNMYNYDPSNFDGYAAVAAIFSRDGKSPLDFEDCAFSNRTEAPLGLGEHEAATFSVYPNPSNGVFTVEGAGMMTVMNVLGQIIKETEIDGQYIMELPQGIYFVKMGDETRKIVVE